MNPNRKPIIAGNWKMYKTAAEAMALVKDLKTELPDVKNVDVVVCPPFTALPMVSFYLKGFNAEKLPADQRLFFPPSLTAPSSITLGAQNVHWEKEGAFTGEISPVMLKEFDVKYAIVGHSERRQYFGETNEGVNKRAKAALANGIRPIVCVGETLVQRESNQTEAVVRDHVTGGLAGFSKDDMLATVIAYEPVWAIGTGRVATPAQAQEVHAFIRGLLTEKFDASVAGQVRIQYGGSVKAANAKELLGQPDIDGALVGGASLDAKGFAQIVKSV